MQKILLILFLVALGAESTFAQVPAQVFSITTGSQGTFQTNRTTRERQKQKTFSFSLSESEDTLRNEDPPLKKRQRRNGARQRRKEELEVTTSSFTLETGTLRKRKRVTVSDTYDFTQTTSSQSFSIDY